MKTDKLFRIFFFVMVLLFVAGIGIFFWRSPTESLNGFEVPEGFLVENAVQPGLVKYPMFAVFDDTGRLFVMESSGATESTSDILNRPDFRILLLEDKDADGIFDHRTVYADSLPFPMGGVYLDGSLIVTAAPDLLKFTDRDGDGRAEEKEVLLSGWTLNHNAAILSGPFLGPDGWLYMADARRGFDILSKEFVHFEGKGARIWRCLPNGSQLQSFAGGGFDNAVELAFMPSGEVLGTMTYFTDPQGGFRDALMHWVEGGVYPKPHPVIDEDQLVRTGELMPVMHKMARVSPSGLMRYQGGSWGDDYEGDLFHAEFNTGRVVQTKLTAAGASFDTESIHFLTSSLADFHPTDVLQEPDGNLLLLNTGGWFIAGCPLSRTAKPEAGGGIYRIKKRSLNNQQDDPWGNKIPWDKLEMGQLAALLGDPRVKVREKSGEKLLKEPLMAIPYLNQVMQEHPDEQVRAKAVFLLFRTQNPRAWNQMEKGLDDESDLVKAAAARVLGMAEVNTAVDKLLAVLGDNPSLPLARQVATALGQIASPRATEPLLRALERHPGDRYFEHAVIFALIQMKNEDLLLDVLDSKKFSRAALIALDQKGSEMLAEQHIYPLLLADDSLQQQTAVWILKNHPEWEQSFIRLMMDTLAGNEGGKKVISTAFPEFVNRPLVQEFLAGQLETGLEGKNFMLIEQLRSHPPKELYPPLKESLLKSLEKGDSDVRESVVKLISNFNDAYFKAALSDLVRSDSADVSLRLQAYQSLIAMGEEISAAEFQWIANRFLSEKQLKSRQLIAGMIRNLNLSGPKLDWFVRDFFPQVPDTHIYYLLESLPAISDQCLLDDLEQQLLHRKAIWDKLSISQITEIFQGKGELLLDSIAHQQEGRLAHLEQVSMQLLPGDVERGREVFFGKGACGSCHAVAGEGGGFAPDLTNIGEIRSRHDILEAIIYPDASFAREYESMTLKTRNQSYTGIVKGVADGTYTLAVGPESSLKIEEQNLTEINPASQSLMPAGLEKGLSRQELSDLIFYLESLPEGLYQR
ncbi:putative membrane-bound dehydrogenase domain-containing protein [Cyclobacterium lianum]|uniref:Putative membrane-bound dehydrogenase domain-containing protein n=1 Tax=Cyclobacterium lianum TaxID=388280 RepID=A0A1M7L8L1_9BACT|nr:PVC-type heme-binding CxxCH protein [Cyclobacterium lianum]SHM74410.1 putative membrane-bound dehydrogenase domain-containing protein [Cyclobacterium lianum]